MASRSAAAEGALRGRRDRRDRQARPDPYLGPRGPTDRRDPNPVGTGRPGIPPTAAHRQGRLARPGQTSRGGDGGIADHGRRARRRRRRRPPTRKRCRPRSPPTPPPDTAGRSSLPAAAQQLVQLRAGREVAGSGVRLLGSSLDHAQVRSGHQPAAHARLLNIRAPIQISGGPRQST
jgi:hypothetical protein